MFVFLMCSQFVGMKIDPWASGTVTKETRMGFIGKQVRFDSSDAGMITTKFHLHQHPYLFTMHKYLGIAAVIYQQGVALYCIE